MASLNIVLVEPQIPQNTGNISRTCAVTGARLHLVGPLGFSIDDAKLKRAGLDYWDMLDITFYESLNEFFQKNSYSDISYPQGAYILFGREDAGLPESLLVQNPDTCVRLPMTKGARSLNLSNTVAVAAYEALRQWGFPELENYGQLRDYKWE